MKKGQLTLVLLALTLCCSAALVFASGPVLEDPEVPTLRCGTPEETVNPMAAPDLGTIDKWIRENRIQAGGVIAVNFHVIYSGSTGNVPESQLDAQITVLNRNYAGKDYNGNPVPGAAVTGYTFFKNSVTRTNSSKWFRMTPGSGAERQAKNSLAVNWTSSLNLYTCQPGQSLLGWATFPWDLASNGKQDGVVIHYGSVPGGYVSPYNLGGTASHEIGHWVGLYHTFQGGCGTSSCSSTGDLICDTPAEGTATSGCPSGKDTCSLSGVDPIHNYMDYSDDACYNQFTTGQDGRADFMMSTYRPLIGSASIQLADRDRAGLAGEASGLRVSPNPFNPRTEIAFTLARDTHVEVGVYDIRGRRVASLVDGTLSQGEHRVGFDGNRLSSGVYMLILQGDGIEKQVQRLTLLK
jgi:hypothetical protein